MIHLFFSLTLYQSYFSTFSKCLSIWGLQYGFKKNANVFFKISNLSSNTILGLANQKEIKELISKNFYASNCNYNEKLTEIQFLFQNDTSQNFQISSKNILQLYTFSCAENYTFQLDFEILNGKNHLDYRYQDALIYTLVFTILYFIFAITFLVFAILGCKKEDRIQMKISIFLTILLIIIGFQSLFSYLLISKNNNKEFFDNVRSDGFNIGYMISSDLLITLIYIIVYYIYLLFAFVTKSYICYFIFSIIIFFGLFLAPVIAQNFASFFLSGIVYLIYLGVITMIPIKFSATKIAFILISLSNFFTVIMRNFYFISGTRPYDTCKMLTSLTLTNNIIQFITIILLFVDVVYPRSLYYIKKVEDLELKDE